MRASMPSEQPEAERRRQYYIKKPFQRRFILQFSALLLVGCAAFALLIYFYSTQTLTTAFINSKLRVMSTADFLRPALILVALVVTALVAIAASIRLLVLSHKIAGPLYRLEKTAQTIGSGKLNFQVHLRSGDELQEFARSMDGMVRDLRDRALEIKNESERLQGIILQASKTPGIPQDLLKALRETQDRLDKAVSRFQV